MSRPRTVAIVLGAATAVVAASAVVRHVRGGLRPTTPIRGDQDPFVYQTSPQQYSDDPSASPQIMWAIPVELTAIPK